MAVDFHPSASKHGISQERIKHVIENCACPLYSEDPDEEALVIFLGPDQRDVPLEVIGIELEGGDLLVIHAMKMRGKYKKAYEMVMGCR